MSDNLLHGIDPRGIATVTLNRPAQHNAFDDTLIAELTDVLSGYGADEKVRALVLRGAGKSFSAGADLAWMKRMAGYSEAENIADANGLAGLMRTLDRLPKPTIALVQGAAYGGGVGLVACCDIAIAAEPASFCFSEVKLGIIPGVISPYVVSAIGARHARRYFMTAEVIRSAEALRIGLVHEVVAPDALDAVGEKILAALLVGAPGAQAAAKDLVFSVADRPLSDEMVKDTSVRIARRRASVEGREGMAAFLEKRAASWLKS